MDKETWRCSICDCRWEETSNRYSKECLFGIELCSKHHSQMKFKGYITDDTKSRRYEKRICDICGDTNMVSQMRVDNEYRGYLLCNRHSIQLKQKGFIQDWTSADGNKIEIKEDYAEIMLYDKEGIVVASSKIDIEDIEKVSSFRWSLNNKGYISSSKAGLLHRHLVNYDIVDHINRDKTDNRKKNLRSATKSENAMNINRRIDNKSGIIGVGWSENTSKWYVSVQVKNKKITKSDFLNKEDAIRQRLEWEHKYFKEFAPQRHLFEEYGIGVEKDV